MIPFKLKVERCFTLLSNQRGCLFAFYRVQQLFMEQTLAIVQQCDDHTDKIEHLHC